MMLSEKEQARAKELFEQYNKVTETPFSTAMLIAVSRATGTRIGNVSTSPILAKSILGFIFGLDFALKQPEAAKRAWEAYCTEASAMLGDSNAIDQDGKNAIDLLLYLSSLAIDDIKKEEAK